MTTNARPNLRQFARGFHLGEPDEENPLGTHREFDETDEKMMRDSRTSLGFMQGLVGGLIEPLHYLKFYSQEPLGDDHEEFFWDVYGNEESRLVNSPVINMRASVILGHEICGNVFFIPRKWRAEDER